MSQHIASIEWNCRPSDDFKNNQYDRAHTWRSDGGFEMPASPSPSIVPIPFSNPDYVDPEEAFIASLASCHMLFFLHFAANKNIEVTHYSDTATGELGLSKDGKKCIKQVTLNPTIKLANHKDSTPELIEQLHHQAHQACFLANSVNFEIFIKQ